MTQGIRVLIADDSPTMRETISAICAADPLISIVGHARDGLEAVQLARTLRPDVITMDVRMPKLDGLSAVRAIMADAPTRIIVVCSPIGAVDDDLPFQAIQAGALELLAKPRGLERADFDRKLIEAIRLMAAVPVVGRRHSRANEARPPRVDAIGLVASTGGPPALATILGGLPRELAAPVLVAQHMAPGFSSGLVRWLSAVTPLPIVQVEGPVVPLVGHVYMPRDEHHLEIDRDGVLQVRRSTGGHTPSGNRLLHSLAEAYGDKAAGVVLTGMGEDGAAGLLSIKRRGGLTIAQDEPSSIVFGMPRAAMTIGAVRDTTPLSRIADLLREAANES